MTGYRHGQERFSTTMGSDVGRDCMYLVLTRGEDASGELVAEAIWRDDTNAFTVDVFVQGIPFSVLELFVAEARGRLPPTAGPIETNHFVQT
jgi:hypothetical protein